MRLMMVATKWQVAAYFDDKASAAQNDDRTLFLWQRATRPFWRPSSARWWAPRMYVPMVHRADGRKVFVNSLRIAEADIEQLDQAVGPITIEGHLPCIAPGKAPSRGPAVLTSHGPRLSWHFSSQRL
jgi:hypothetical protein